MPQFVAAAYSAVSGWLASTAFASVTYGTLVKAALLVASVAYTSRQNSKLRKALNSMGLDQGRTLMTRDPVAPRRLIYGQVLVSGPIVFLHASGTKNEYLHMVIILAAHEVEEIGDIYLNDDLVTFGVDNEATGKFAGHFRCLKKRGVPGDTADHYLVAETGGKWTANHTLSGCAYLGMRFKWNPDLFPNGLPTVKAVVKGKKVYDPRTGLTAYSANAALCAGDFLRDETFGKGVALARIRSADWIEAANIADENVVLADASTEKRYTCNGTVNADMDPNDVLNDLAGAMAGTIVDTGGTWTIRAGAHRTPSVTLTDADFIGGFTMQPRQSRQDTFNRVRGIYISPQNQWAPADFPPIKNTTYKAKDGGIWLDKDITLSFTTSPATAQRLAKIELERGRQQITCSVLCSLKAMQLMPGDVVEVTRDRLGWSAKQFEVTLWDFKQIGTNDAPALGIEVSLRETAASVWDWADGEETTVDLAPNTTLPDLYTVPTPTATFLSDSSTVIVQPDGTVMPRIKVSWVTPNNIYVESGGVVEIEYKAAADSVWLTWGEIQGNLLEDYISADLKVGIAYNVRVRFRNSLGVRGAYHTSGSITAVGDTASPVAPTALSAVAKPGYNLIDWEPSTSATVNEYLIYRSVTSAVAGFALLASTAASQYSDGDVTPGGSYWYKVVAQSAAGYASAELGPSGDVVALASTAAAVPSDPTAPVDQSVSGVYGSSDGTIMAYRTVRVYPLPANAVWQNLLMRRNGASEWLVAGQFENTGNVDVRIDDLTPGVTYDIAVQAWSGAGGSNVIAGTSITAPNKTANVDTPGTITYTSGNSVSFTEPPQFGSAGVRMGLKVEWAIPSGKDVYVWQWVTTPTDTDAAADAAAAPVGPGLQPNYVAVPKVVLWVDTTLGNSYFRVRAVNRSGIASAWAGGGTNINTLFQLPNYVGNAAGKNVGTSSGTVAAGDDSRITGAAQKSSNLSDLSNTSTARSNLGLGSVATQNTNDVSVTGIKTGGGASTRQVNVVYDTNEVVSITGGSGVKVYAVNISLSNRGFSVKPDTGLVVVEDREYGGFYDSQDGGSTSTNAVVKIFRFDGGDLGSGNLRLSAQFKDHN